MDIKKIIEKLVDPFLKAGEISISLREKGLKKEIKSDNTPVSNGDLEVNKFITKNYLKSHQIFQLYLRKLLITKITLN
jgi:3'-phosphoadenosine 5'-phosphosulfate (PAPS) 3'-phosphatase